MIAKVLQKCFVGKLREPGEEFEVKDDYLFTPGVIEPKNPVPEVSAPAGNPAGEIKEGSEGTTGVSGDEGADDDPTDDELEKIAKAQAKAAKAAATRAANKAKAEADAAK